MATGNGYNRKEFKNQMEQLENQFAGMGQSKEKEGHETGKRFAEQEQVKQNTFEKQTDTYYDARLYETNEPQHRVPNQDDDKDFFMGQVKALTAALSVPLSFVITPFEGGASKFKRWIKEIEKYGLLSGKQGHEQTVESESDENPESEQSEYNDQNYEVPLNTPAMPLDEDMEIGEINSKVGLGFTRKQIPKPRKPVPKPRKNIAVSKQHHVENCLVIVAD